MIRNTNDFFIVFSCEKVEHFPQRWGNRFPTVMKIHFYLNILTESVPVTGTPLTTALSVPVVLVIVKPH